MTVGRNDPCICGSRKKYEKCCGSVPPSEPQPYSPGKFRFEPGSCGGPDGAFVPSILCQKWMSEIEWRDHFVLANPMAPQSDHDSAVAAAEADLAEAFAAKQDGGTDADLAMSLKSRGYLNVTGFKAIKGEGTAGHRSSSYKTTFARIHRKLNAYGFKYADPSWVKEATISMIYQMCLEFKKLIENPRIEDLSWEKPEWIFVYQEEVSALGMLSTPAEYCLARVLSNDLVTLKAGDHIIALNSGELRHPSFIDPAIAKNREQSRSGQRFSFKVEGEVKNRKGSLKNVTWAFAITFLTPIWERSNGKIFYLVRAVLQSGRSNPSSWTVEDREKLWNKLLDQILSYMPPVEEKQMTLPIPGVIPEPKIKILEIILEPGFKKILENQSRSYAKSLASGMFGI